MDTVLTIATYFFGSDLAKIENPSSKFTDIFSTLALSSLFMPALTGIIADKWINAEKLYGVAHVEHHFNGLITNKIPLFNRLKWHLVAGSNIFYVNRNNYYLEAFAGIENIFKLFRVDFVTAYQAQPGRSFGIRVGLGGILGGSISVEQ